MKTIRYTNAACVIIAALFIGLALQSCNLSKPLTQAQLEGYWVLKKMNGTEASNNFKGALPTLQFNFGDTTISGTGGCNKYSGAYTYKDGVLTAPNLAVTQMLCLEGNLEGQFLLELGNETGNTLSLVDNVLTFTKDGKVILEFEKGEAPAETPVVAIDSTSLSGTWVLKNIDGADATAKFTGDKAQVPTLTFNFDNNKITGQGGCNRYNAPFALKDGQLVVGPILSTKMACANLEGEAQFAQALADTSLITMPNENVLQLAKKGTVLLEFEKAAAAATPLAKK
jgi:heat shock protein HslJ